MGACSGKGPRKLRKDIALTQAIFVEYPFYRFSEQGMYGLLTGEGEAVVDEELIEWLRRNPDEVRRLRIKSGLV